MTVEIKPRADIMLPNITLPAHADGGWALPGGGVTYDPIEANEIAKRLEKHIGRDTPYNEDDYLASRKPEKIS